MNNTGRGRRGKGGSTGGSQGTVAPAQQKLVEVLQVFSGLTGLYLCFKDFSLRTNLPVELSEHRLPACLRNKRSPKGQNCWAFCAAGGVIDTSLRADPSSWKYRCPFGLMKIAIPVMDKGRMLGVIYATQISRKTDPAWWCERHTILSVLPEFIRQTLEHMASPPAKLARARMLQDYVDRNLENPVRLADVARALGLSPSRASHVIKQVCGRSFTQYLSEARLDRAAHWLRLQEYTILDIAMKLCFYDQSHFSRAFTRRYRMPPLRYRKSHSEVL